MVVSRPMKRVKRVVADSDCDYYYSFHKFGHELCFEGPFRSNVRSFLESHAEGPLPLKISSPPFVQRWRLRLRFKSRSEDDTVCIVLNVVEETVPEDLPCSDSDESDHIHCNNCRLAGWSGNPVCKRRYHFIIQADAYINKMSLCCGSFVRSSASRCKSCDYEISKDTDLEDENQLVLEDPSHLLHGVIHANGFGHLLRVNGREGGSQFLSGCDIMGLWDRICIMLKARKISVMDVSKKYGFDYRLLHAVQKGRPWYGNWGYEFATGSFGLTYESYKTAVESLSKTSLASVLTDVGKYDRQLRQVVLFYCSLSKKALVTVQDLVCFIMELLHKFHNQIDATECSVVSFVDKDSVNMEPVESKWASTEVGQVTSAMLKVLQVADKSKWITWRDVRGATCCAKDPELVDFALRDLAGKVLGSQIVQCRCMFSTRTLEYRLKDRDIMAIDSHFEFINDSRQLMKEYVLEDLKMINHTLLHPLPSAAFGQYGLGKQSADASRKLLDCKQFIKDYEAKHPTVTTDSSRIRVFAVAEILKEPNTLDRPPPELLVLPQNATVADLKREAAEAFRDVYICLKRFQVENIPELKDIADSMDLMLLLGSKSVVTVQGFCSGNNISMFRTERGSQVWTVDCSCGTREDDGEFMIQCDNCQVWQHTRCVGISDTEGVPKTFICKECNDFFAETSHDSDHSMLCSSSVWSST